MPVDFKSFEISNIDIIRTIIDYEKLRSFVLA